jgi:uncharacterized delta-60 repeat protein
MNITPRSRWSGPARPFHPFGRGLFMLLSTLLLALPVPALAAPGDLDPSFGGDGRVVTSVDDDSMAAVSALVVQPDGKLVAAGKRALFANGAAIPVLVVARYNHEGRLDSSFGAGGLVRNDFSGAAALVLQPDGKVVTAGTQFVFNNGVPSDKNLVLQRFNPDGSPDTSFGSTGLVVADFDGDSQAFALVLQADGKLVVAGAFEAFGALDRDFALARYHSDGSLDTSFGTGGLVVTDIGEDEDNLAFALVLQADGKLVVAGALQEFGTPDQDFALAR